jgi:hypothetical protein
MISTNFLEYYGIVGAVQKGWKKLISEYGRLHDIKNDIVDKQMQQTLFSFCTEGT